MYVPLRALGIAIALPLLMTACLPEKATEVADKNQLLAFGANYLVVEDSELRGQIILSGSLGPSASFQLVDSPKKGKVELQKNGKFTYTCFSNQTGRDSFTAVAVTSSARTSNIVEIFLDITDVNDLPSGADEKVQTMENTAITVNVLENDSDPESPNSALTVSGVGAPSDGMAIISGDRRSITYTPRNGYYGNDMFTYQIRDAEGGVAQAKVEVNVKAVNDGKPVPGDDIETTIEDPPTPLVIDALENDTDVDNDLLVISLIPPQPQLKGTVAIVGNKLQYTPQTDFNGKETFSYVVSDNMGGVSLGNVEVTVTPVNDNPEANPDSAKGFEDQFVMIDVLKNDNDLKDPLDVISIASSDALSKNGGTTSVVSGQIRYNPPANASGMDEFNYTITDSKGGSATAKVTVEVEDINDPPVAGFDSRTIAEDVSYIGDNLNRLISDIDDLGVNLVGVTLNVITPPSHPSVQPPTFELLNAATGAFILHKGQDYFGQVEVNFRAQDARGELSNFGKFTFFIENRNDAPVVKPIPQVVALSGEPVELIIPVEDVDGDTLTITPAGASNGGVTATLNGSITQDGSGKFFYTSNPGYAGSDAANFNISDGQFTVGAQVDILINSNNRAPTAFNADVIMSVGQSMQITLNATDPDSGDELMYFTIRNGALTPIPFPGNVITFTAQAAQGNEDMFQFYVKDKRGTGLKSNEAIVHVHLRSNYHQVFVTKFNYTSQQMQQRSNSSSSGIPGADALCQDEANAAGLTGTWLALLSDDFSHARERINFSGPIVDVNNEIIANDFNDLWDGSVIRPIDKLANGDSIVMKTEGAIPGREYSRIFTGSSSDGQKLTGRNCNNWLATPSNLPTTPIVSHGYTNAPSVWFAADIGSSVCTSFGMRLYCARREPEQRYFGTRPIENYALTSGVDNANAGFLPSWQYPADVSLYKKIVFHVRDRKNHSPGCGRSSGYEIAITNKNQTNFYQRTGHTGVWYSVRACVYDVEDKLVSSHLGTVKSNGPSEWRNPDLQGDINGNGTVEPADILFINSYLTASLDSLGEKPADTAGTLFIDPDGDNYCSASDLQLAGK